MIHEETLGGWAAAPSAETLAFNTWLEAEIAKLPSFDQVPVELARQARLEGKGILPADGPLPGAAWVDLPPEKAPAGGPGRVRVIEHPAPKGVYLHIHGGGWTFGAPQIMDGRNIRLSQEADVTVVSTPYRLSPEHRWPGCAEDCLAAAEWTLDYAAQRNLPVVIGGESAGGHLTAVTLLRLREKGRLAVVKGAMLAYGVFDMRMTPSARNWGARNLVLSTPVIDWFLGNLLGPSREFGDPGAPSVSPLLADLTDMPPALFFVGDLDPLLDDTLFMAQRWRAAGAEATLQVWPGAIHAFDYFDDPKFNLPIALDCQSRISQFVKDRIAAA